MKTLEERFWSKVNKSKGCWIWTDKIDWTGYGKIRIGGRSGRPHQAHRISYELHNGAIPEAMVIDHVCHNRACVNPDHLRTATNKQNVENPSGLRVNNTSGHQGVMWDKRDKKWRAYAKHNGKYHSAGYHSTKEAAAEAAQTLRLELFTHNELDKRATR